MASRSDMAPPGWALQIVQRLGDAFEFVVKVDTSHAFAVAFWVSLAMVVFTGVFSLLLPKKKIRGSEIKEETAPLQQ